MLIKFTEKGVTLLLRQFSVKLKQFESETLAIEMNLINYPQDITVKWLKKFLFCVKFRRNGDFLGIRIVRIFGQKYSRFKYLKLFE